MRKIPLMVSLLALLLAACASPPQPAPDGRAATEKARKAQAEMSSEVEQLNR